MTKSSQESTTRIGIRLVMSSRLRDPFPSHSIGSLVTTTSRKITAVHYIFYNSVMDLHRISNIPTVMASLFGLSKCIVTLNKRIMKSKVLESKHSKKDYGGNLRISEYVLTVLLSQGAEFNLKIKLILNK
jgi:hypothetical protein